MNFIVMGVAGCGKSTVAKALSARLQIEFLEGDDFHSDENVALMSAGQALTDKQREPWLQSLNQEMLNKGDHKQRFVLSCSALKKTYREHLAADISPLLFVYLKGSQTLIKQRMMARENHFMPSGLIESQFEALQEPAPIERHITVDVEMSVDNIVQQIITAIDEGEVG